MYISSPNSIVAIDAATGAVRWKYTSSARGNTTNRGVVVSPRGSLFSGQLDNSLIALDSAYGRSVWKDAAGDTRARATRARRLRTTTASSTSASQAATQGGRGQFGAYDAKSGKEVWKFWTVPGLAKRVTRRAEGDSWAHGARAHLDAQPGDRIRSSG
jgi:outer membrane protein assembly factor BamB